MNVFEKEGWIEALESGRYIHGKHRLMNVGSNGSKTHCCLGVLAEVFGVEILPVELDHGDDNKGISNKEFNRVGVDGKMCGYEWFEKVTGLTAGAVAVLYTMNDSKETVGYTKQADWIRENVIPK